MKPSELSSGIVREELERLIKSYPNRTGSTSVSYNDYGDDEFTCVYYTDEDGVPVSYPGFEYDLDAIGPEVLANPVCIVGLWIEEFHPEFKDDLAIRQVLLKNSTMRHAELSFEPEVKMLLVAAQDQQDADQTPWGNIDLDKIDPYWR